MTPRARPASPFLATNVPTSWGRIRTLDTGYTGIAIANHELFAANVAGGGLDVFNSTFGAVATITDPNANGSNPFNVQNVGGTLYVIYTAKTGAFQGALTDTNGNAIIIPGLWGLIAGNGGNGGAAGSVYFAAGGANETSGLFGRLDVPAPAVPEASTTVSLALLLALGLGGLAVTARRKKAAKNTSE